MDDQITSLVGAGVLQEIKDLREGLENLQGAFKPLMEEIRSTSQVMGTSSKDVRSMINAFEAYNKVMQGSGDAIGRYNSMQKQLEAAEAKLIAMDKEKLIAIERIKEAQRALEAQAKQIVTAEAAMYKATESGTRSKIAAREETRRLVQEIKRQLDVQNGTITTNGKEELTLRAKAALLSQLREKYKDVGSAVQKELIPQILQLDKELKKADAAAGVHTRSVGDYSKGITSLIPGLSRFTSGFGAVGIALGLGTMALGTYWEALKYGIGVNKEFEQSNANLAAVLGVSRRETQALQEQALELGRITEWSATQVTQAQEELAKLGFSQQTIKNMTEPLLGFATALDASLPQAAQVAGQALRAFNKPSSETKEVLSEMVVAANKSAMDFQFLERSIAIVGASASVAKVPLKDTLSLLGVLSNSGLDASRAATALRNIFLYLADDSKKLGKELKGTHMDAESISKAFVELRKKGVDLADMFELTDKRAVNALAVLIQNAEQITKLRDEISKTTGALDQLRKTRLDTLEGDLKLLKSSWDAYWLSFRDNLPMIRQGLQWITERMNDITDNRNKNAKTQEGSSSYGEDVMDNARIKAVTTSAQKEFEALNNEYQKALGVSQDAADAVMKKLIAKREELYKTYAKSTDAALKEYYTSTNVIDEGLSNWTETEFERRISKQITTAHGNINRALTKIAELRRSVLHNTGIAQNDSSTYEQRVRAEKNVEVDNDLIAKQEKYIQSQRNSLQDAYQTGTAQARRQTYGSQENTQFSRMLLNARNAERKYYGKYLTEMANTDAVAGIISENERTMMPQSSGQKDFKVDTGKKSKAQLEQERKDAAWKALADKEEQARIQNQINLLKEEQNTWKGVFDAEYSTYEQRLEAAAKVEEIEKKIAKLTYEKAAEKITDEALRNKNLHLTGKKLTDKDGNAIIDPLTGKQQTDVEKATYEQRLALYSDYKQKLESIDNTYQSMQEKATKIQDEREEKSYQENLKAFKDGLEQRIKDVEAARAKEQAKLAKLKETGNLNDTQYKDETAKLNMSYAGVSENQVQLYYNQWLKKLDLPEALKNQLAKVFEEHAKELKNNTTEASTKYSEQTGNIPTSTGRRSVGSVARSTWNWITGRSSSVKYGKQGEGDFAPTIDERKSESWTNKTSKGIQSVVNSDVVQQSTKLFSEMTSAISSYYDQQIAKIDDLMTKQQEAYEKEKELLDAKATNLENNYSAGLVSENNYLTQKRKNDAAQKALDKKNAAEKEKLEKRKRDLQVEQAKWEKRNSYAQAVMSTANGVANALTIKPTPLGIIMASAVGVLGAAQIALIASQSIPQYAKGTDDHEGGLMVVGDGGKNEYVLTPSGNVTVTPSTPTYMDAPKHTKVFKDERAFLSYLDSVNATVDKRGDKFEINVNAVDKEQKATLKEINKGIKTLNANQRYEAEIRRQENTYNKW